MLGFPGVVPNNNSGTSAWDDFKDWFRDTGYKIGGAVDNALTGDRDYGRSLETLGIQNAFTASEAEKARSFASEEAQKNRAWQEQMSNSAYSRAASDLERIGINPYAMMSGFSAASTPAGSTAGSTAGRSGAGYYADSTKGLLSLVSNAFMLANTVLRGKFDIDVQDMKDTQALSVARIRAGYRR